MQQFRIQCFASEHSLHQICYEDQLDNKKHHSLCSPLISDPDNAVEVRCAGTRSLTP